MARTPSTRRFSWVLTAVMLGPATLPAVALETSTDPLVAQAPEASAAIPAEVQGWFDGAKAAAARGDGAEALRLQKRVVAWLEANPGASVVFRARALINFGNFLSGVGQRQEALAPTQDAIRLLRPLEGRSEEARRFLALALNNLGKFLSEVGRRQEALAPTEEAVRIRRELAKTNAAYLGDLANSLNNLGFFQLAQGEPEQAFASYEASLRIIRPLAAANPAFQEDLQRTLNNLEELKRQEGRNKGG